jgi:2'-5' RNA ligase
VTSSSSSRRQLTLFVTGEWATRLQNIRRSLDPVQASLIQAHVTLCREDEIHGMCPSALLGGVTSWAGGPMRLTFDAPARFGGHGVLLPCVQGSGEFTRLRQWLLHEQHVREHVAHITLAHPRNSRVPGNTEAALTACPSALELHFASVALVEQLGTNAWELVQEAKLGSNPSGVA